MVEKVAVSNGTILAFSLSNQQIGLNNEPKKWFVIVPTKQIEIGFTREQEFLEYVKKLKINKIKWININNAYKQFEDTRCLPWIMGCK